MTGFAVLLVASLLAIAGLVTDGARAESAHLAALNEAEQAARAGAAVLGANPRQGTLDPSAAAVSAAEDSMSAAGRPGTAWIRGGQVTARVAPSSVPTTLLALVGIDHLTVSAQASARAVDAATGGAP